MNAIPEIFPVSIGKTEVNLTVSVARVSIPLRDFGKGVRFEYSGRLYSYNGVALLPGPVIHVNAGAKLTLNLFNKLGNESYEEGHKNMNKFHGVNTTNVHFHGVHGNPMVDDVFKTASPGESLQYKLSIPRDHAPGLHWYHTHAHGSSYLLLMGGLFGPLIIDAEETLQHQASSIFSLPSVLLLVHLYRLRDSTLCDGSTMTAVDALIQSNMSSRPQILNENDEELEMPSDLYLVNGQHRPLIKVQQGQPTLLRLMFAAGSCYLNISLPAVCRYDIAAVDGVPLKITRQVKEGWLYFTTATRYDIIISCSEKVTKAVPVTLTKNKSVVVFYLDVYASRRKIKRHSQLTLPMRPWTRHSDYLFMDEPSLRRDISFSQLEIPSPRPYYVIGQGTNCSSLVNSTTCYYEYFSGQKGKDLAHYQGFAVPLGSVIEANVFGDPTDLKPHPLHLHVNHFTFVGFVARQGGKHENLTMSDFGVFPGEIRDTIPILDGVTIIRWQAATYTGEVVYHCHALHHEDRGMMTSYLVYRAENSELREDRVSNTTSFMETLGVGQRIFLLFSIVFLMGSILCVIVAWFKVNPPDLGSLAGAREATMNALFGRLDEQHEMERIPLRENN